MPDVRPGGVGLVALLAVSRGVASEVNVAGVARDALGVPQRDGDLRALLLMAALTSIRVGLRLDELVRHVTRGAAQIRRVGDPVVHRLLMAVGTGQGRSGMAERHTWSGMGGVAGGAGTGRGGGRVIVCQLRVAAYAGETGIGAHVVGRMAVSTRYVGFDARRSQRCLKLMARRAWGGLLGAEFVGLVAVHAAAMTGVEQRGGRNFRVGVGVTRGALVERRALGGVHLGVARRAVLRAGTLAVGELDIRVAFGARSRLCGLWTVRCVALAAVGEAVSLQGVLAADVEPVTPGTLPCIVGREVGVGRRGRWPLRVGDLGRGSRCCRGCSLGKSVAAHTVRGGARTMLCHRLGHCVADRRLRLVTCYATLGSRAIESVGALAL
jgi:hypothetical protein